MGVFYIKLYGVWNNSSIIKEMIEVAAADIAKAQQQTGKEYFLF